MVMKGKNYEAKFRRNFLKIYPKNFIYRLPDQVSYLKNSSNPCDFFIVLDKLYLVEIKSVKTDRYYLSKLRQYDEMLKYKEKAQCVILVYYYTYNTLCWYTLEELEKRRTVTYQDNIIPTERNMLFKYLKFN